MSRMKLSTLARVVQWFPRLATPFITDPSHHLAVPTSLLLTLAQAAALLPGPIGIPEELLRFVLYGDVKGVPDIWVEKVPHRQHLGKRQTT